MVFLSNFSDHRVKINNQEWATVEHWYQAQKYAGTPGEEAVRNAETPARAKKLANNGSSFGPLRKDWEHVKESVMYTGLTAKFTQHRQLAAKLLATGNAHLVEHSKKDAYWGDGGNGVGKNRLGFLIERVRSELKDGTLLTANTANVGQDVESAQTIVTTTRDDSTPEGSQEEAEKPETENVDDDIEPNTNHTSPADADVVKKRSTNKSRLRRNVWKDETGRSLFEMDSEAPGQVSLVGGPGITIPVTALPSHAKFVVHRNQFSRRNETTEEDLLDEEDDENDEYLYRAPKKTSLSDFFGGVKEANQSSPAHLSSPSECLEVAQNNLELYHLLDESDMTKNQVQSNLRQVRDTIISFISQSDSYDDTTMNQLLTQLTALNEVVGEA